MIINLKQFISDQLYYNNFADSDLYENYTPQELEMNSMSHQSGQLSISNDGKILIFENKFDNYPLIIKLPFSLDGLIINESIIGQLNQSNNIIDPDEVSTYIGGGTLTNNNGLDFQFSTPLYDGVFTLEEKSGFGSKVVIRRIK